MVLNRCFHCLISYRLRRADNSNAFVRKPSAGQDLT